MVGNRFMVIAFELASVLMGWDPFNDIKQWIAQHKYLRVCVDVYIFLCFGLSVWFLINHLQFYFDGHDRRYRNGNSRIDECHTESIKALWQQPVYGNEIRVK